MQLIVKTRDTGAALERVGAKIKIRNRYDNFIGGAWVPPVKGQYFENRTPISGEVVCTIARSTAEDIEKALDAAHAAAAAWGKTAPAERAALLFKIADRMEANLAELATVETIDNGKPIRETMAADLPLAVDHFRYFASCIRAQEGSLSEIDDTTIAYHYHEPLGVVGQIIPWNFPLLMAAWKLAPALAAGNCVVLKPAEQTPMGIMVLMDLIGDLLPPGVLNVVNGFGIEAGKPLASQPAHRQDRLHRRDHDGAADHAICGREHHPGHARARRQVAQRLLRRRDGRGRRFLRQGARGLHHVRPQPGRGVHVSLARAGAGVDLRRLHRTGPRAREEGRARQPARSQHDDRRAGLLRPVREDPVLYQHRQGRGRQGADRRQEGRYRPRLRGRLLRGADGVQGPQQDAHLPGGDLRARASR